MHTLAFLPNLGAPELIIIGIVMLLLFGRRLPEVGRSLGQGIVSFKKGLREVEDEIDQQSRRPSGGDVPAFESAKSPNNPDMASAGHSSANPEPVEATPKTESGSGS